MKNHEVAETYGQQYTGSTWCGRFVTRETHEAPWTNESGKKIAGHEETCGICTRAKEADRRLAEAQERRDDRIAHTVRRDREEEGDT